MSVVSFFDKEIIPRVPRAVKDSIFLRSLYMRLLYRRLPDRNKTVVLYTLPKSGTNYFRFFFMNYLAVHFQGAQSPVLAADMKSWFPYNIESVRSRRVCAVPLPHLKAAGYDYFIAGHVNPYLDSAWFPAKNIIALYRNPLDYIVSIYHYIWAASDAPGGSKKNINDILDSEIPYLIQVYRQMDRLSRRGLALQIAYEEIVREPRTAFALALKYLAVPVNMTHLDKALEFSSFKTVRAQEETESPLRARLKDRPFTRSGKIGEWKTEMPPEAAARVKRELAAAGIDINRFIFE